MLISIRFFNATITLPIRPLPEAFLMPTFSVDNLCFVSFNFKFSRRLAHSVITAQKIGSLCYNSSQYSNAAISVEDNRCLILYSNEDNRCLILYSNSIAPRKA